MKKYIDMFADVDRARDRDADRARRRVEESDNILYDE